MIVGKLEHFVVTPLLHIEQLLPSRFPCLFYLANAYSTAIEVTKVA